MHAASTVLRSGNCKCTQQGRFLTWNQPADLLRCLFRWSLVGPVLLCSPSKSISRVPWRLQLLVKARYDSSSSAAASIDPLISYNVPAPWCSWLAVFQQGSTERGIERITLRFALSRNWWRAVAGTAAKRLKILNCVYTILGARALAWNGCSGMHLLRCVCFIEWKVSLGFILLISSCLSSSGGSFSHKFVLHKMSASTSLS